MQAIFYLHCKTKWGENVFINFKNESLPMAYVAENQWKVVIDNLTTLDFSYTYTIKRDEKFVAESKLNRIVLIETNNYTTEIYDDFVLESNVFQTLPFKRCYFSHKIANKTIANQWILQVYAPLVEKDCSVGVIGSSSLLGNWDENKYLPLNYIGSGWWNITIESLDVVEYKFIIIDKSNKILLWEDGNNRITDFTKKNCVSVLNLIFRHNFRWKSAGVAIPVFSLRSKKGWGIGDFSDLKYLVDWASKTGLKIIQILPINDTTNTETNEDSYPYRANSIYALHPILLDTTKVGILENSIQQKSFEKKSALLNKNKNVSYAEVFSLKTSFLKLIYIQDSEKLFKTTDYKKFYSKNEHWLLPYAVYSCLREDFKTANYALWNDYSEYSLSKVRDYAYENKHRVEYFYFIQYHATKQLKEAHAYANKKGVSLKGDLPIGISADSVDAWMQPNLFNLDVHAGAPPDDFSKNGQNWGFPTYNWVEMKNDDFAWWKARFKSMVEYFDAYRIDHILGFFRIWQIPVESLDGVLGYFNPAMPFSKEDLMDRGFAFSKQMLQPFITEKSLQKIFDKDYYYVVNEFFEKHGDLFKFLPQFSTQKHFIDFIEKKSNILSVDLSRKILDVYTNVLFIEDKKYPNCFHPRIAPFETEAYKQLSDFQKEIFKSIHDEYFYVRHNEFWENEALTKLPLLLKTNDMLVCGEDLGMIPQCVPNVMSSLQILSLEVQRMPKQTHSEFVNSNQTPYLSVYTTGTHDTSTIREWWQEDAEKTSRYYHQLCKAIEVVPQHCNPTTTRKILEDILSSNSIFTIFPMQDILALNEELVTKNPKDERINNPANPNHYWCYRMNVDLETLLKNKNFNSLLKKMLKDYNRI